MALPTLPTASLFDLYKAEKADFDDGIADYPTFRVWKETYLTERQVEMDNTDISEIEVLDDATTNKELNGDEEPTKVTKPATKVATPKSPTQPKKKKLTNMDLARTIFQQMVDESDEMPTRKMVMEAFISKLQVSAACASTYHYNIKQKYNK